MRHLTLGLAAALLLGGCDYVTSPYRGESRDYELARRRWEASEPRDYTFTIARSCFCVARRLRITVHDGVPVAVRDADTGAPAATTRGLDVRTVDDLFDTIADALTSADQLSADYDRSRGYPTRVQIDYDRYGTDDEVSYYLTDFQAGY